MQKPLVKATIVLERFNAKGGWTFARIPVEVKASSNVFGWVKVRGFIDDYEISNTHLMPMGNKQLFLPVNAGTRKQIKKGVGDAVKIVLFADEQEFEVPEAFMECLRDEPDALKYFEAFTKKEQKQYIDWINQALKTERQIERMGMAINKIMHGLKFDRGLFK